jgi:hypothetical protein
MYGIIPRHPFEHWLVNKASGFLGNFVLVFWPGTGVLQSCHLIDWLNEWSVELKMQQMAMQDACQYYMTPTQ